MTSLKNLKENVEHEHVKQLLANHDIDVKTIDPKSKSNSRNFVYINNSSEKHESGQNNLMAAHTVLKKHGMDDYSAMPVIEHKDTSQGSW